MEPHTPTCGATPFFQKAHTTERLAEYALNIECRVSKCPVIIIVSQDRRFMAYNKE